MKYWVVVKKGGEGMDVKSLPLYTPALDGGEW
jgi:hypothetical protein